MKKLHAHQKGFSNLLPLSKSLKPCPQTTPFSLFPSPNASSIWFSRHKDTPDKGHTTDGGRTGVRSQVICLQSLTEREVLKLTSSELEDIWLEGVFIFRFKASPYSIYMNTVSSAMWTGQVCWWVSLFTIFLPRVTFSVFVENKGVWEYANWNITI